MCYRGMQNRIYLKNHKKIFDILSNNFFCRILLVRWNFAKTFNNFEAFLVTRISYAFKNMEGIIMQLAGSKVIKRRLLKMHSPSEFFSHEHEQKLIEDNYQALESPGSSEVFLVLNLWI